MEVFEIETERLQLRQFRVEDAQDVFAIFSDEQTTLDCGGYQIGRARVGKECRSRWSPYH